jgi:hypothetical protein
VGGCENEDVRKICPLAVRKIIISPKIFLPYLFNVLRNMKMGEADREVDFVGLDCGWTENGVIGVDCRSLGE